MKIETFLQHLINGMSLGALYALIAIGYTMVYGILRLINFAHGGVFMMGVYFAFYLSTMAFLPWWLTFTLAIAGTAIMGFLIDRIAYKPLRSAPRISALITAIGMAFFIESLAVVLFSGIPKSFRGVYPPVFNEMIIFGGEWVERRGRQVLVDAVRIPNITVITIIFTGVILLVLWLILYKTKIGMAMRAIAMDIPTVSLMGINVDKVIGVTFALGSALAACGGLLWASRYPQIWPYMGFTPGLKAFIAAVFGGIGSVQGAVLGGVLLGLIEVMIVGFFPHLAGYRDAFAFLILIVVLLIKPSGLLGKKVIVKV